MPRYFFKCHDCLSVIAQEQDTKKTFDVLRPLCACGATEPMDCMGRVTTPGYISQDALQVPCNSRCTFATGPHCDCPCNGENHGTGRLVEITKPAEGQPRVKAVDQKALAVAQAFRAAQAQAKAALEAKYRAIIEAKQTRWLSPHEFQQYLGAAQAYRAYHAARKGLIQKTRLAKLEALCH